MKRHFQNLISKAARAIKHWWLLMLSGLLCIVAGILVFVYPVESYMTLGILFGVLMLIVGAAQLIIAASSGNYLTMRGYVIVGGVLDLLLGIFLCVYPAVTLVLLPILLGIWMMYHSFMIIAFGGDLEILKVKGGIWSILGGILLLLLSILILLNPFGAGITAVVVITGIALLVFGFLLCAQSLILRTIHVNFEGDYPAV